MTVRRGSSGSVDPARETAVLDAWREFDFLDGPQSQYLMRGAAPHNREVTPEGTDVMGDEVGNAALDGRWRGGDPQGRQFPGYRLETRMGGFLNLERQYRYVPVAAPAATPAAAPAAKRRRRPARRRRPLKTARPAIPGIAPAVMRPAGPGEEPDDWDDGDGDGEEEPMDDEEIRASAAGILDDLLAPRPAYPPASPFGTHPAVAQYGQPAPAPQYGAPAPAYGGPPAPQYGAPAPQYGQASVKGEPHSRATLARPDTRASVPHVGYWTDLTSQGENIRNGNIEIGTVGESIERVRAAARDFMALPTIETTSAAPEGTFRALVYRGMTTGRYTRQRAWDLARQYGEKWGRAKSALSYINDVDDDERLLNEAANEVRDRVNDCRNLVRAATSGS